MREFGVPKGSTRMNRGNGQTGLSAEMETPDYKGERLPYMQQLDTLRAFAVLTVVIHHYSSLADLGILASLGAAFVGVKLFFVLSGFLITGILLSSRDD